MQYLNQTSKSFAVPLTLNASLLSQNLNQRPVIQPWNLTLVKLGKRIKVMYNDLVRKRLYRGGKLSTYVMDTPSPFVYHMVKLSKLTLSRDVNELYLLPGFISKLT